MKSEPDWQPRWIRYNFAELEHLRDQGMLDLRELDGHGVYFITRRLLPRRIRLGNAPAIQEWMGRALGLSMGSVHREITEHFMTGEMEIHLGCSKLPNEVERRILSESEGSGFRSLLREVVSGVPPLVLYCGETHNFQSRVRQHLDGSDAWERLTAANYEPADLDFRALALPPVPDPTDPGVVRVRRSIERLLAHLTLAPFTVRPG